MTRIANWMSERGLCKDFDPPVRIADAQLLFNRICMVFSSARPQSSFIL